MTTDAGFDAGGESACWMHLVCPECGAVLSDDDGHDCVDTPESQPGRGEHPLTDTFATTDRAATP